MSRKVKQAPMPVGFAAAFGMALDDARTMRLLFEIEALQRAGAAAARIARVRRGDFTAADYAEANATWTDWLPEAEAELEARQHRLRATCAPFVPRFADAA